MVDFSLRRGDSNVQTPKRSFPIKFAAIIGGVVMLLFVLISSSALFENLDAHELMVVQAPFSGELTVHTDPGIKWQGWGKVTKYPRRAQYAFQSDGKTEGTSKRLRFNDGGHGTLSGAVSWEMPLKPESIIEIHKTFGNAEGVEQQAVAKMIDAAVYLAGPLMSSTESSGERRSELVQFINDQAERGVYVTVVKEKELTDPITQVKKTVTYTEIVRDEKGMPKRQQGSILAEFNIKLLPMSISDLKYDTVVEDQIKQRQVATTQVQIAQANALRAKQEAITTEEQGKATAARAKWEQETIKAKEVTLAEQKWKVAEWAAKEAEQYKREQTLRGEGEAARKRLVMEADGALDAKLQAWIKSQEYWAKAVGMYQGNWVPSVTMGQQNQTNTNGAQTLVDMLTAKTAKDLGLDMSVTGKNQTAQKK